MSQRDTHTVEVAGLTRHFPLFEVAPGVRIAVFNMLGDTYVVKASAAALAERLKDVAADVLVTAEAEEHPPDLRDERPDGSALRRHAQGL